MTNTNSFKEMQGRIQLNAKEGLQDLIKDYYFFEFSTEFDINQSRVLLLVDNIKKSEIAIIGEFKTKEQNEFFIISFNNTVIFKRHRKEPKDQNILKRTH